MFWLFQKWKVSRIPSSRYYISVTDPPKQKKNTPHERVRRRTSCFLSAPCWTGSELDPAEVEAGGGCLLLRDSNVSSELKDCWDRIKAITCPSKARAKGKCYFSHTRTLGFLSDGRATLRSDVNGFRCRLVGGISGCEPGLFLKWRGVSHDSSGIISRHLRYAASVKNPVGGGFLRVTVGINVCLLLLLPTPRCDSHKMMIQSRLNEGKLLKSFSFGILKRNHVSFNKKKKIFQVVIANNFNVLVKFILSDHVLDTDQGS